MVLSAFGIRSASFASCLSKSRGGRGGGGPRALLVVEGATDGLRRIERECPNSLSLSAYDEGAMLGAEDFPAMTLCARWMRFGGARGPPGRAGWAVSWTGRGVGSVCWWRFERSFAPGEEEEVVDPFAMDLSVPSRFMLAFRPIEAKKPPPLLLLLVGLSGIERIEGVPEPSMVPALLLAEGESSFATALAVNPCARLGYGSVGGGPSSTAPSDSDGRAERSVATYASMRLGNVTSDPIDPRET